MKVRIMASAYSILFMWSLWDLWQFRLTGQSILHPLDAFFLAIATFFLTLVSLLSILEEHYRSK